jgi:hypothetical protein
MTGGSVTPQDVLAATDVLADVDENTDSRKSAFK